MTVQQLLEKYPSMQIETNFEADSTLDAYSLEKLYKVLFVLCNIEGEYIVIAGAEGYKDHMGDVQYDDAEDVDVLHTDIILLNEYFITRQSELIFDIHQKIRRIFDEAKNNYRMGSTKQT